MQPCLFCTGMYVWAGEGLITISSAIKPTIYAAEGPPDKADDGVILNLPCLEDISSLDLRLPTQVEWYRMREETESNSFQLYTIWMKI